MGERTGSVFNGGASAFLLAGARVASPLPVTGCASGDTFASSWDLGWLVWPAVVCPSSLVGAVLGGRDRFLEGGKEIVVSSSKEEILFCSFCSWCSLIRQLSLGEGWAAPRVRSWEHGTESSSLCH